MACVVVVLASRAGNGLSWQSCNGQGGSTPRASELEGWRYMGSVYEENLDSLCECRQGGKMWLLCVSSFVLNIPAVAYA